MLAKPLVIATRGSKLALWQAEHIRSLITSKHNCQVELLILKTKGDIILDVPLSKVGGKGLFVKEIEEALFDGRADLAVHSMKDVPMVLPNGLALAAITDRVNPLDLLLSSKYSSIDDLPKNACVGTSSLRRQAQLLSIRPDLNISFLRGNVDTRIKKMLDGEFDAIVMAAAGIKRLDLKVPYMFELEPSIFLPAAGQGALGLEVKSSNTKLIDLLSFLNHKDSFDCVTAERSFLAALDGGCQVPIGAYAIINDNDEINLEGLVASVDGKIIIKKSISGNRKDAVILGNKLANDIKESGGGDILREVYEDNPCLK